LAVRSEHDVARLEVAMEDSAAVRVVDRLAHHDEAAEKSTQLQRVALARRTRRVIAGDCRFQGLALDELHRVERAPVWSLANAVDRHDAGMLEPSRHFRLLHE